MLAESATLISKLHQINDFKQFIFLNISSFQFFEQGFLQVFFPIIFQDISYLYHKTSSKILRKNLK